MDELIKLPTDKLLKKFGSGRHKPGSGSATALLALISCKMIQTVVTLSDRDKYLSVKAQLTLVNQDLVDDTEPYLMWAIQEDSDRFDKVINARDQRDKAKKGTKERKQLAAKALTFLRDATKIPYDIGDASQDSLHF